MATPTYTKSGTKAATAAKLDKSVFGVAPTDHTLLKEAYLAYLGNARQNLAVTKTRADVRGGGRKPWRQKGTGRARIGSTRAPHWRHGGVVAGPTGNENYRSYLAVNAKRQATRQALSLAAKDNKIIVIDELQPKGGKTAELAGLLAKIEAAGRTLLVVDRQTADLTRASRNLADVRIVRATYLNAYDILNADVLVFTSTALDQASAWLSPAAKKAAKETA